MTYVNNFECKLSIALFSPLNLVSSTQGMVILDITYGIPVKPDNDPNVASAEKAMKALFIALMPGAFLVVSYSYA